MKKLDKMEFEDIIKSLEESGINFEIDYNPSEEKLKEIKEKIDRYNKMFPIKNKI